MDQIDLTKFTLKEIVGKGSFGEVRKVQDKETGEIYAAKISLDVLEVESETDVRDFRREVEIMAMTNHPSIVKFIGFNLTDFHNDPKPVIITEYMTKGSLSEVISLERKMLSIWDETKKLINIYGIASAMAHLHSFEVLHRDLKPENILMDDYLHPKISDFGLSKIVHKNEESMSMKSSTNIKGTPIYISPEILKNQKYEKESDVYAFALIVYEIVTNDIPFEECKQPHEIYMKITEGHRPQFKYPLHEAYQSLIERCWDQEPSQRPTFDEIVYELKNDPNYITDQIDEAEYQQYVDYIDECKKSFDKTKKMIHIDDYIKSKGGSFKKTTIDVKKEFKMMKRSSKSSGQIPKQKVEETMTKSFRRPTTSQKEELSNKTVQRSMTLQKIDENHQSLTSNSKNKSQPIIEQYDRSQTLNPKSKEKSKSKFKSFFSRKSKSKPSLVQLPDNESNSLIEEAENDPEKQFLVGQYFIEGKNNFPKNIQNGITYLKMSIKGGCLEAVAYYCHMLIKGENIPKDLEKAKKTLKKYLKRKDASIYFLYGRIKVKEFKTDKAIKYFEKASEGGNPKAMYNYAKILFLKNNQIRKAMYYFDMAKKNGYDKYYSFLSQLNARDAYSHGKRLLSGQYVDINIGDGIRCFNIAISKGSTDAMVAMGSMLVKGDIVKADKKKAFEYFSIAAEKENIDAMINCGNMLIHGDGVPVDEKKACDYFKKAADLNHAEGMFMYGKCLENGKGISPNKKDALLYYRKAANNGNKLASKRYDELNAELNSMIQKSTLKTTNSNNSQTLSPSKGIANNNPKDSIQNSNQKLHQSTNSNTQRTDQRSSQNSSIQRNDQRSSQNSSNQRNDQRSSQNSSNQRNDQRSSQNSSNQKNDQRSSQNSSNQRNDQRSSQSSSIQRNDQRSSQSSSNQRNDQRSSQNSNIQRNEQRANQNYNDNYLSQSRGIANNSNDRSQNNNQGLYQNTNNSGQRIDQRNNRNLYQNTNNNMQNAYQNNNQNMYPNNNSQSQYQSNNQNMYPNNSFQNRNQYQSNNQNMYPNNSFQNQNQYQSNNQIMYPNNGPNQYQNANYNRPNITPDNNYNYQGFNQNNKQYFAGGQKSLDFSQEFVPNQGFYPPRQEPPKYHLNQEFYPPRQENSDFKFVLHQDFRSLDDESSDFKFRLDQDFGIPDQERSLNFGNNQNNNYNNNQRYPQNINSNNQTFNQNVNYNNNRSNNFNNQITSSESTTDDFDDSYDETSPSTFSYSEPK